MNRSGLTTSRRRSAPGRSSTGRSPPPFRQDVPCYKNAVPDLNGPLPPRAHPTRRRFHEARDPRAPPRLHRHRRPRRAGDRDDQRDPGPAAGQLPVLAPDPGPEPLRAEGRVQLVSGRDARSGADGRPLRGQDRERPGREPRERARGRDHEHRPQVRAAHPHGRLAPAAPAHRPAGHDDRDRSGPEGTGGSGGLDDPARQHGAERQPGPDPGQPRRRHPVLPPAAAPGRCPGALRSFGAAVGRAAPLRPDRPRHRPHQQRAGEAASEPAPRDHQLRQAQHRARAARHAAGAVRALFEHRAGLVREGTERDPGDAPGVPADASADAEHSHQRQPFCADSRPRVAQADSVGAGACAGPAAGPAALPGDHDPDQDQIRPFARASQKPLKHLNQASQPLAETTTSLTKGVQRAEPPVQRPRLQPARSSDEGYLFWLSWLNHNTNAVFFTQDAGGPLRHGLVQLSCATAGTAVCDLPQRSLPTRRCRTSRECRSSDEITAHRRLAARWRHARRQSPASWSPSASRCRASAWRCSCGSPSAARCR